MLGETVGTYRIVEAIGAGGVGTVYRAEHVLLGKPAAVKVLRPEYSSDPEIVERFFNEAKLTTSIKHPGIVEVFDFGYTEDGRAYLVMELLEGMSLTDQILARAPLREAEAAMLLRSVCHGLVAAHAKGVIHRDLKPDNIFVISDADSSIGVRTKILDFGIAKLATIGPTRSSTLTGSVMGTPTYMSPEQCRGIGILDQRTDLYALGCIHYELLTGRPPFIEEGFGELLAAHMFNAPEPPSCHAPTVSAGTDELVLALLAKSPDDRVQSAMELAHRLTALVQHGGLGETRLSRDIPIVGPEIELATAEPTPRNRRFKPTTLSSTASEMTARPVRRSRFGIALVVGAALAAGIVSVVAVNGRSDEPRPPATPVPEGPARLAPTPPAITTPATPIEAPRDPGTVAPAPDPDTVAPTPAVEPAKPVTRPKPFKRKPAAVKKATKPPAAAGSAHDEPLLERQLE